ncbi:MAG: LamG-like jellyroll fold domain-containing protein [Planctomycetia bacterium]|nr:LamG-like jellyroll fold domain-containing protein [Planctomycetia bacterium]
MVGFWNFDAGNATNSVTGTQDVALQGTGGKFENGQFISDGHGYLQGTGENATIANLPTGDSHYTISAFVTTTATQNVTPGRNEGMGIMGWGNYGSGNQVTAFRASSGMNGNKINEGLNIYWWGTDKEVYYDANTWGTKFNSGSMNHVATTYNDTGRAIYLNGQLVGSDTKTGHNAQNSNFRIGATHLANSEVMIGTMDNASLYSNALEHGEIINISTSRYNGLVSWWVNPTTNPVDRVSGLAYSATPVAGITRIANGNQVMDFNRTLNASETAYFTGQMADGHVYDVDKAPAEWSATNTAWVRTLNQTWDGSTTPLGIYVGGTLTQVTLSTSNAALDKSNYTLVLAGGKLALSGADNYSKTLGIDGGHVTADKFYTGGSDITLNSGSLRVNEFRIGNGATVGNYVQNSGEMTTSWFTFGEAGWTSDSVATATINGGTVGTTGFSSIMVGRGGKGVLNINGGIVHANGTYDSSTEGGAISVGSHNKGIVNMAGGTLNIGGMGLHLVGHEAEFNHTGGYVNATNITNNGPALRIKSGTNYNLSGGTLNVKDITGDVENGFNMTGGMLSVTTFDGKLIQKGGVFSPGYNFDGTGTVIGSSTITGDYTLEDGTIQLEIVEKDGKLLADSIQINGKMTFIDLEQIELVYDPEILEIANGTSFDILTADGGIELPETMLPSELSELISDAQSDMWLPILTGNTLSLSFNSGAVPEPSTWVLLVLGGIAILGWRKRS